MPCMESIKEFDWKKNWIWIALGVGIFVVLIVVLIVILGASGNLGPVGRGLGIGGIEEYQTIGLEAHNAHRKKHNSPPLTLSSELNDLKTQCAKYYVEEVKGIDHSCPYIKGKKLGENLYAMRGPSPEEAMDSAKSAADGWYSEINSFDFKYPIRSDFTGHFVCMIWKSVEELGIGHQKGDKISVLVGLYAPGCFKGDIADNVLPLV